MDSAGASDRLYRIGEAARALGLETSTLRFWETAFPRLCPIRTPKGQRLYREMDMLLLRRIHSLLHDQGMTIDGARRVLDGEREIPPASPPAPSSPLGEVARELQALRRLLQTSFPGPEGNRP
jgi:DNA-binding transcriptional MerR regulator